MPATERTELDRLLVAVAGADKAAFRRLYDLSAPKLFATILRIVKVSSSAEEILQDVYLRVWQNARSYSPDAAPARVWMNAIARNRAIDVVRQKTPVVASSFDDGTDWFERIAEDRDREADMIDVAALRRCLGTIEPQARDCVLAAYYEGFSREELAQRYARPVNTIKTWLHRSLASLRACLEEDGS